MNGVTDPKTKKRNIFYQEPFSLANEMVLNEKIKSELETLNLPKWWREGDTLRMGYAAGMDPKKTIHVSLIFNNMI